MASYNITVFPNRNCMIIINLRFKVIAFMCHIWVCCCQHGFEWILQVICLTSFPCTSRFNIKFTLRTITQFILMAILMKACAEVVRPNMLKAIVQVPYNYRALSVQACQEHVNTMMIHYVHRIIIMINETKSGWLSFKKLGTRAIS